MDKHHFTYLERDCYMQRNSFGAWCGYAEVPAGSPLFGLSYSDKVKVPLDPNVQLQEIGHINAFMNAIGPKDEDDINPLTLLVRCHGGLTFAGPCYWRKPEDGWAFGFDCSHVDDAAPGRPRFGGEVERTADFVISTIHQMVEDLIHVENNARFRKISWVSAKELGNG